MTSDVPAARRAPRSRWHDHDWAKVLSGEATADCYFQRSGLIRKDRLCTFVPPAHHPETAVVRSFAELQSALQTFGANPGGQHSGVRFVLKKAHSSNAHG